MVPKPRRPLRDTVFNICPELGREAVQRGGELPVTGVPQDEAEALRPEVAKQHPMDPLQCPDVFCLASVMCHNKSETMF